MDKKKNGNNFMEKIVSLAKRRGFIFPGSEIYGGLANSWDFGHLGTELFNNISRAWWEFFVQERGDIVGVRGPVIMNPKVWEASGHLENFTDPLVECKICHERIRQDKQEEIKEHEGEHKGEKVDWTEPKNFNLLFKTFIGPVEDEQSAAYLRGETAATMFTDFKIMLDTTRRKVPFGVAQIGRAFRNEITTGNFVFRTKEFTIAEFEYFVKPGDDERAFEELLKSQEEFLIQRLGLKKENIKPVEIPKGELAHYSKRTIDWYYNYPFGWDEMVAIANRTDYDLRRHQEYSGQNLKYRDPHTGEEYLPYVIEPSFGVERMLLAVLADAYTEVIPRSMDKDAKHEKEVVLKLDKRIAPIKAAVLPLSKKEPLVETAKDIAADLRRHFMVEYDDTGSIGKRYRRQDEIGTPYCITVDFDSLEDKKITVRDRDTMKQERIGIKELTQYLRDNLE